MNDRIAFRIHGMDCADEVALLRRELEPLVQAPDRLSFDILRGKMLVGPGEPAITTAQVAEAVRRTGMCAEVWRDEKPTPADTSFWGTHKRTILTALCGVFAVAAFANHAATDGVVGAAVALMAGWGGIEILRDAKESRGESRALVNDGDKR